MKDHDIVRLFPCPSWGSCKELDCDGYWHWGRVNEPTPETVEKVIQMIGDVTGGGQLFRLSAHNPLAPQVTFQPVFWHIYRMWLIPDAETCKAQLLRDCICLHLWRCYYWWPNESYSIIGWIRSKWYDYQDKRDGLRS